MDNSRASLRLDPNAGGKLLDDALAKREDKDKGQAAQSYRRHLTDVYVAWCGLVETHKPWLERVAARCQLSLPRLLQSSLLCVALHDLGKLADNFQQMMLAPDGKSRRAAVQRNYRHEIAALWFIQKAAQGLGSYYGCIPGNGLLEVLAVAGHHKYLAPDDLFAEHRFLQTLAWKPDAWSAVCAAYQLAAEMFAAQGWQLPEKLGVKRVTTNLHLSNDPNDSNYPFECLCEAKNSIVSVREENPHQPFRELFIVFKGLLMTADWMASGASLDPTILNASHAIVRVPARALTEHTAAKVERDRLRRPQLPSFQGFRLFQSDCGAAEGHVLAIAPTGSGKTEAALLWALGQIERGRARKLLFLLPTMVTANSLYKRIDDFFRPHGHKVALVHSTADLLREENPATGEGAEADRADVRAKQLQRSHLFLPVTVGTVDQLLVTLFHAGRWALKSMVAADAAVVIDEVHAYDPHTTGLLALLIRQFRELGARFMVMSATMPTDLKNTLRKELTPGEGVAPSEGVTLVEDKELLSQARNRWEVCDTPLTQWLRAGDADGGEEPSQEIQDLLRETSGRGDFLRVLIVVNTVTRCQEIARLLKDFGPVCYHSKFIFLDRREKEEHINHCQPRLVVATQVVEVSLDIDYDVLLTECAPFDALAQRAGRVNRIRRPSAGRVIVFPCEVGSANVYGEPPGVLDESWRLCRENQGKLTESALNRLVEEAYKGRVLSEHRDFAGIQAETLAVQRRLSGVLDNPRPEEDSALVTRLEKYHQVSVIPEPMAATALKADSCKRRLFELQMPLWYVREHRSPQSTDEFPICQMNYDPVLGGQFLATKKEPEPGLCII